MEESDMEEAGMDEPGDRIPADDPPGRTPRLGSTRTIDGRVYVYTPHGWVISGGVEQVERHLDPDDL